MTMTTARSRCVLLAAALTATACATPRPLADRLPAASDSAGLDLAAIAPRQDSGNTWRGGIHGLIGYRQLDEDTWSGAGADLDAQIALGIELDFRPPDFPLGIEAGLGWSFMGDDINVDGVDIDVTGSVGEIYFGPRLTFDLADDKVHPYVGGGLTLLYAEIDASADVGGGTITFSDSESSAAGYVHAGVLFDVGSSMHLGVDGRLVTGSDLGDGADADYGQIALVIGAGF